MQACDGGGGGLDSSLWGSHIANLPGFGTRWGSTALLGEIEYEQRLQNTRDLNAAQRAADAGDYQQVAQILAQDTDVGLLDNNGQEVYGEQAIRAVDFIVQQTRQRQTPSALHEAGHLPEDTNPTLSQPAQAPVPQTLILPDRTSHLPEANTEVSNVAPMMCRQSLHPARARMSLCAPVTITRGRCSASLTPSLMRRSRRLRRRFS